jgi:hypothetical protein
LGVSAGEKVTGVDDATMRRRDDATMIAARRRQMIVRFRASNHSCP